MDAQGSIKAIGASHPALSGQLKAIEHIYKETFRWQCEAFYESKSLIEESGKDHRLVGVGPDHLIAWTRHAAYSTRVRMFALETAILSELSQSRPLGSMVMIRSHMEVAGLAALCLKALTEAFRDMELASLEILIPKTYFGTSLKRQSKKDDIAQAILIDSEQDKISSSELIRALDRFGSKEPMHFRRTYALLCDFVHANYRGVSEFAEVLNKDEGGWLLKYREHEPASSDHLDMALDILLQNMRPGYAASELLRLANFPSNSKGFWYESANDDETRRIWNNIIQHPSDAGS